MTDHRDAIIEYLWSQLIGPLGGGSEELDESPTYRYLAGVLYPQGRRIDPTLLGDLEEDRGDDGVEAGNEDPIALAHQQMPSSAAISFVVTGAEGISASVSAGVYSEAEGRWHRRPLAQTVRLTPARPDQPVFEGRAELVSRWRSSDGGHLVTVAFVNSSDADQREAEHALCQVSLSCTPIGGEIAGYPTSGSWFTDEEEEEQALLHRARPIYAIGHGTSATWDETTPRTVALTWMPAETVPDPDFSLAGFDGILRLNRLASVHEDVPGTVAELNTFVDTYAHWIEGLSAQSVPPHLAGARTRIRHRLELALARMREGVSVLASSDEARTVFALANRAMVMQMTHSRGLAQSRKKRGTFRYREPDYVNEDHAWRPFQLAFLLLNLASLMDDEHADRDVVDLIWFPTGGGKTEAYLGLVAMTVLLRRMRHGDDGAGTAVITRYTLRLLTSQQFQRAAALVCALELLRREAAGQGSALGSVPITAGLWVGGGNSPNRYSEAVDLRQSLLRGTDEGSVSFQIELCPWCGTEVVPEGRKSEETLGIDARADAFRVFCPTPSCPFHDRLPLSPVDDDLYDQPPTLLIATVDKFARLTWEPRSGVFLGAGRHRAPDLLIQDELHLIAGPLGTIMGMYEAAFDTVMRQNGGRPKIVASTATIRNSAHHVRGLFDRDVFLFPPSGLNADDSYFVRLDRDSKGRRYVGIMAQAHSPVTANVRVAAGLLQAPIELELDAEALDHVWTLVAYHNSLRELGRTVTLARDDIPSWIEITASDPDARRDLDEGEGVIEITSNIPAAAIPRELEKLQTPHEHGAVSLAACTNMISVGVDVQRLGLMLVVGQPKTTSEYIQATSRVGRSRGNPGLVVTLLSSAKSRDRSHFETFRSFHGAMYRSVEPTSVTPFALPVRRRALHAALVVIARHAAGLTPDEAAADFDAADPEIRRLLAMLLDRVASVDPLERDATETHLRELVDAWTRVLGDGRPTRYQPGGKAISSLLRRYGRVGGLWATLDSMRNVDTETLMKVRGER